MTTPAPRTKYAVCFPIGRYDESAAIGAHDPLGLHSWKAEDSGKPLPKARAKMTRGMPAKMKELVKAPPKWVSTPVDEEERSLQPKIFPSIEDATEFLDSVIAIVEAPPNVHAASEQETGVITRSSQGWMPPVPVVRAADYRGPKCDGTFREFFVVDPDIRETSVQDEISFLLEDYVGDFTCYLDDDWHFREIGVNAWERPGHAYRDRQRASTIVEILVRAVYDLEKAFQRLHPDAPSDKVADFWLSWQVQQHLALFCAHIEETEMKHSPAGSQRVAAESARAYVNRRLAAFAKELLADADRLDEEPARLAEALEAKEDVPTETHEAIDEFLARFKQETGIRATRTMIWKLVGHSRPRQFQYWQAERKRERGSARGYNDEDDRNFRRVLSTTPDDFAEQLRDKGLLNTRN